MSGVEIAVAAVLSLAGLASLRSWLGREFEPASAGERVVYSLHVTARVGLWFAFAGAFLGYSLVENPYRFRWYVLVIIALAGLQLLTALALARSPSSGR